MVSSVFVPCCTIISTSPSLTLPQGLSSSAGIFQRLSNIIMAWMPSTVLNYLDDYVCGTHTSLNQPWTLNEHIDLLWRLFTRMRTAGVSLKPSKCNLFQDNVEYVVYKLSNDGLFINDKNIEKIRNLKPPRAVSWLRSVIGALTWLRRTMGDSRTC